MYVMDKYSKWKDYLNLFEFSYSYGYHASLNMGLFEALYDKKCNMTVRWDNPLDEEVIGP
jgi:hypothetical protein